MYTHVSQEHTHSVIIDNSLSVYTYTVPYMSKYGEVTEQTRNKTKQRQYVHRDHHLHRSLTPKCLVVMARDVVDVALDPGVVKLHERKGTLVKPVVLGLSLFL